MEKVLFISISLNELEVLIQKAVNSASPSLNSLQHISEEIELLDSNQTARLLHISKVTLHTWKLAGRIPYYRIGSRIRFKKKEVIEALIKIHSVNKKH